MNNIIHKIFSEIHRLLSIASEEELRNASAAPNTSLHIRDALLALTAEKATSVQKISAKRSRSSNHRHTTTLLSGKSETDGVISEIFQELERLNKKDIQKFCESTGLKITIQAKDSRDRILRRIIGLIRTLSQSDLRRALWTLRSTDDSQTEGWVGVIRKGR